MKMFFKINSNIFAVIATINAYSYMQEECKDFQRRDMSCSPENNMPPNHLLIIKLPD